MKAILRALGWLLLVALIVGAYAAYRIGWGKPFTITQLANRQAIYQTLVSPELATYVGAVDGTLLDFHSGKLSPITVEERDRAREINARMLAEVREFNRSKLEGEDALTYDLLEMLYEDAAATDRFDWMTSEGAYPFDQMNGVQVQLPNFLLTVHVVKNAKLARNYVERLSQFDDRIDEGVEEMARQQSLGATPPVSVIEKSRAPIADFLKPEPEAHPLVVNFEEKLEKLDALDADERAELVRQAETYVRDETYPAYRRLDRALEALIPVAAEIEADGVVRLPDGEAFYAAMLRQNTTTEMSPDEVHRVGLEEVERISAEADAIFTSVGLSEGTVGERLAALGRDPAFQFEPTDEGREQILEGYRTILKDMEKRLPEYFATIPPQEIEVARVPEFREKGSAGAYYQPAAMDGSRPGTFYANLRDVTETPKWTMKTLAYHEGIPGHFFQISYQQNLKGLPLIRQFPITSAYTEGWALYTERLAKEMGVYANDPYGDLGRLQAELFRAVRLVVDTGLHAKGWTREEAIDYMTGATGMARSAVETEIERYMVMPGQACAYKIGMLKILELRARAKAALDDDFDIKGFHEAVLGSGALQLPLLERKVEGWIEETAAP